MEMYLNDPDMSPEKRVAEITWQLPGELEYDLSAETAERGRMICRALYGKEAEFHGMQASSQPVEGTQNWIIFCSVPTDGQHPQ